MNQPPPPADWEWTPPAPAPGLPAPGPVPARPEPPRPGLAALFGLAIAVAVALLGVPFGLAWAATAPDVPVIVTEGGPVYGVPQPEQPIAADGWFAILALPVGVIAAFGVWLAARRVRGTLALASLIAGSIGTGLLGWWVGRQIGLAGYRATLAAADAGARLDRPADLGVVELGWWPPQLFGVLLVPALAAAATYTLLAAWSRFPNLRDDDPTTDGRLTTDDHRNVGDIGGSYSG